MNYPCCYMARSAVLLALTMLSPLASAQVPSVNAFFDAMAIDVAPGRQARFVAGDNVDGYYAGLTQSSGNGEGYVTRAGTQLLDYASSVDATLNERAGAFEQVLPWGRRLRHASGVTEEIALLAKRHALALAVAAPRAGTLAIAPLLRAPGVISQVGPAVLVAPGAGEHLFVALMADQPFRLDPGLVLRTSAPATTFTVVAAVGASAAEALARARAIDPASAIAAEKAARHAALTRSYLATSDASYNRALNWAKASSAMFVVDEFGAGIWAGLPWFRDNWGRDTFIALPGTLLVSGQFEQARAVLANFARYQQREPGAEYGRIPNRVSATDPIIFNTVDGTPWMLREALEYIRYTGDKDFAAQMFALAVPYFDGAIASYVGADGLLRHDSADTWMDARIANRQPWSARGPQAVEIQALWYTALQTGAELARQAGAVDKARQWSALAATTRRHFLARFWDGAVMADRLREDGSGDVKVRPNQLMLVSIPFDDFIPPPVQAKVIKNAVEGLLYPYGIASLSDTDPYFHPRHDNPAYHHKDAAYHQGTIWGWNAGFTVSALTRFGYQEHAWRLTDNLGRQMLGTGPEGAHATLGHMSELLDAVPQDDGSLKPSGTWAQSWSVAEYARNAYQDYLGFRPDLPAGRLRFVPALPASWTSLFARLPFGAGETLEVDFTRTAAGQRWQLRLGGPAPRTVSLDLLDDARRRQRVQFVVKPDTPALLTVAACGPHARHVCVKLDGRTVPTQLVQAAQTATLGTLRWRTPPAYVPANFPMLRSNNALQKIILDGAYR
ncbi:amylo-alpha-1,6-glucosidase [Massilia sp. DWR3-1-1]|uniref:amylo-alpha-1,6-glucosidase n=1 Tax=Massilia sp. DWR3-1-1 TaxID=2804559 RepID=UPI003CF873A9